MFDTHVHFVTDDFDRYPLLAAGAPGGHVGVPANPAGEGLRNRIAAAPLTAEAVLSEWNDHGVSGGAAVQYRTAYGTDNTYLIESSSQHRGRIRPVVIVEATNPAAPVTLRELVTEHGAAGVRLTGGQNGAGEFPWLDSDAALQLWAEAERLDVTVVLMYLPPRVSDVALRHIGRLAKRFEGVNIVLDHIGWPSGLSDEAFGLVDGHRKLASHHPNVYFKLTTSNFEAVSAGGGDVPAFVCQAVDDLGGGRILWGSDYGNAPGSYGELVARATEAVAKLTPEEQIAVLDTTGRALFGG